MSTAVMLERMAEASPHFQAEIAGVFYLLTFVTGNSPSCRSTAGL
jgi:hypothetical protein